MKPVPWAVPLCAPPGKGDWLATSVASTSTTLGIAALAIWPTVSDEDATLATFGDAVAVAGPFDERCVSATAPAPTPPPASAATATAAARRFLFLGIAFRSSWLSSHQETSCRCADAQRDLRTA